MRVSDRLFLFPLSDHQLGICSSDDTHGNDILGCENEPWQITRLRQEFYGYIYSSDLIQQRITNEIVHELGHLFKLSHCDKRYCVMHFSNSLKDTAFVIDVSKALLFNLYQ